MGIESFVVDLIEEKKKVFFAKNILYALSLFYRMAVFFRNFLYDRCFFKSYKSSLPVISVGNLVAGGTGKTPFVQKLVEELSLEIGDVAIITRGYRSKAEHQFVLASLGGGPLVSSRLCGDEPYWLALYTKASIWVGKNRIRSLQKAALSRARIACLEDGFQHRKVKRDVEIVLLSGPDLFGKGYFLPRGYLRESPQSLSRADWIIVTQLESDFCKEAILQKVRPFSKAPIIGFSSSYELDFQVVGKKVGAFCGIAKPSFFYKALGSKGVQIVKTLTVSDHHCPSLEDLSHFALECQKLGAEFIICTEKDWVKLDSLTSLVLPIQSLKMKFECVWNENIWKEMVQSIQTRMENL